MATTLTKRYQLVYEGAKILVLGTFEPGNITGTTKANFETDDIDEMKTKLATLGLTPDPRQHRSFCNF